MPMPAEIIATLLYPGGDPPWRVEFVLTSPASAVADRATIEHVGSDWNEKAGPVLDRMRATAHRNRWGPEPADLVGAGEPIRPTKPEAP